MFVPVENKLVSSAYNNANSNVVAFTKSFTRRKKVVFLILTLDGLHM